MAVQITTNLSNSVRTQYEAKYKMAAMAARLYDQIATPVGSNMSELEKGSAVQVEFLAGLPPVVSTISQLTDITPRTTTDAVATVTPSSRGDAIQWSEALDIQAFTDYGAKRHALIGDQMIRSVDLMASDAGYKGTFTKSPVARASLDAGTSTHRLTSAAFVLANSLLVSMQVPMFETTRGARGVAFMHPFAYQDLITASPVLDVAKYTNPGILFNYELGELNGFTCIVNPNCKVFWGAGLANGTDISDTIAAAVSPLDLTFTATSGASMAAGQRYLIGSIETGSTFYETNESVVVASVASTTITIIGEGPNGGFKYAHPALTVVSNKDNVYPVLFAGKESLAKVYATSVGEYGKIVGPKAQGVVDQFATLGWKFYGGYGRISENRLLRSEFSSSLEA